LSLPIKKDQKIAKISVLIDGFDIYSSNIYSNSYIGKKTAFDYFLFFVFEYKNFYKL
jgi:hypothetical protein